MKAFAVNQIWAGTPNRASDDLYFEIVGRMNISNKSYWVAAKNMPGNDVLDRLEVNLIVVDGEGVSIPSNLTFSPPVQWTLHTLKKDKAKVPTYA